MAYTIEIDFSPAYEFVLSLEAYARKKNHKVLELGSSWLKSIQSQLPSSFSHKLDHVHALTSLDLPLFIWKCPVERSALGFLNWFAGLSSGELHEIIADCQNAVPSNLVALRDQAVSLLAEWHNHYFSKINPDILSGLQQNAEDHRALLPTLAPIDVVEKATNGIRQHPVERLERVVLIPQYHARPINLSTHYERLSITCYPADALSPQEDSPSPDLLRFTRALSDETRLKILRFLRGTPKTFSDITEAMSLSKSTIHYHLILLRGAGLIRVNTRGSSVDYTLRQEAVHELNHVLFKYLSQN